MEFEELNLLFALSQGDNELLLVAGLVRLDPCFELDDGVLLALFLLQEFFSFLLKVFHAVLSLELFAHGESYRARIQSRVGGIRLLDVVTDTEEQKTALRLVKSDLADNLVKALTEEFLTHRAETSLTCLSLKELLIEHLSKTGDIDSGSRLMADLLAEMLAYEIQIIESVTIFTYLVRPTL